MTHEILADLDDHDLHRLEVATDWLMRFQGPGPTEEDMTGWIRWCEADPANLEAFERIRSVWHRYSRLTPEAPGSAAIADSDRMVVADRSDPMWGFLRKGLTRQSVRRARALHVGGLLAALVLLTVGAYFGLHSNRRVEFAAANTNKSAVLPDGSSLELGAKTVVAVRFTGAKRDLSMSSGRAYFKVRPDKIHPFVVRAGDITVAAVGTAFDVRRENDRVMITVEEGTVQITPDNPSNGGATAWRASAGSQVVYSESQRTATISAVNTPTAFTWRQGQLVYESEILGAVVDEVNRYSSRKIVVRGPRTAALVFSGTVFTSSIDDWVSSITTAFDLRALPQINGDLILESRSK